MNKTLIFLLCFLSSVICTAQSKVEKFIIQQGFEDVRHISANGREIVYLGSKAFSTDQREINSIKFCLDSISSQFNYDRIDVVVLKNRFPIFHMLGSRLLKDSSNKIIWYSDFYTRRNLKVLKNSEFRKRFYNSSFGKIDLLFYPQLRFKNSRLDRMYLWQFNLNPTIEMNLWKGAQFTAQLIIPLHDDYSMEESEVRPGFLTLSQEFRIPGNIYAKATVGNFNSFRGGGDLKLFRPVGRRIGLYGQVGVTAKSIALLDKWYYTDKAALTWKFGSNFYIKEWNLLLDFSFGKYLGGDYSARGQLIRFFKNSSVGFYAQSVENDEHPVNGGFFFSIALPPYTHKRPRHLRISSARYFNLEYIARPSTYLDRNYQASPDESSSENFFNSIRLNQIIETSN